MPPGVAWRGGVILVYDFQTCTRTRQDKIVARGVSGNSGCAALCRETHVGGTQLEAIKVHHKTMMGWAYILYAVGGIRNMPDDTEGSCPGVAELPWLQASGAKSPHSNGRPWTFLSYSAFCWASLCPKCSRTRWYADSRPGGGGWHTRTGTGCEMG